MLAGIESDCFGENITLSRLNLFCKNLVCTSQEIYYVSATKINQSMLFVARTTRNKYVHSVDRMQSLSMVKYVVLVITIGL
jgi:hypothetical protein